MTTITSRAAIWILAAGLVACLGTPSFAADPTPWPTTTGALPSNNQQATGSDQQAAPNAVTDQSGATAQPEATDRSLTAERAPADAVPEANPPPVVQAAASSDDSSTSDKASIVGKIFIAAGTLLTLGSAARMFMI
jgi:hypothetical protein